MTAAAQRQDSARFAQAEPIVRHYMPPKGLKEAVMSRVLRAALFATFKPLIKPPVPVSVQRGVVHALALTMPGVGGVQIRRGTVNGLEIERIRPIGVKARHAIVYLHGGAFCVGSPRTHRAITTRLALMTQAEVFVPRYRLVPEHAFPAQYDDAVRAYRCVLQQGYAAKRVAVVGDSAGANIAFALPAAARAAGLAQPAALVLMSPALDLSLDSGSVKERARRDPMLNASWGRQAVNWLKVPAHHALADLKQLDLSAYPPSLVQVGEDEILYDDALWTANAMAKSGRHAELEIYLKRWHVFHLHGAYMPSAVAALRRQAEFLFDHWAR